MNNLTDKERLELLGEVFMDELRIIREYLSDIPLIRKDIADIKAHIANHDQRLDGHDYDISQLKQQLA